MRTTEMIEITCDGQNVENALNQSSFPDANATQLCKRVLLAFFCVMHVKSDMLPESRRNQMMKTNSRS